MWFYTAPAAKEIGLNVCCDFGVILFCSLSFYCLCVHSLSQYPLPLVWALCAYPIFNLLNSEKKLTMDFFIFIALNCKWK